MASRPIDDGFRWASGRDQSNNVDLTKFVKPHEGLLTHRSSPVVMWWIGQLSRAK